MMDREENPSTVMCRLCGEAFSLPEDGGDGNLPLVLLCSHIYCTTCLLSIQCDNTIKCPECEVESTLPEGGVTALQEDSRIIGLIYTAKMKRMKSHRCEKSKIRRKSKSTLSETEAETEDVVQSTDAEKIEKTVDEALVQAAANLSLLENINETLKTGLAEQVKCERARLEMEIKEVADKAFHAIQKWKDVQFNQLTKLETHFPTSNKQLSNVQERIKSLGITMQMAREVRRLPSLEKYCTLNKVLEMLHDPVVKQSFDMECIALGSGLSFVFQSETLNQNLTLSLTMEKSKPGLLSEFSPKHDLSESSHKKSSWQRAEGRNSNSIATSNSKSPSPRRQDQGSSRANSLFPRASTPSPRPHRRVTLSTHSSTSDIQTPDVIVEEIVEEEKEPAHPPTGPELAIDKSRIQRRKNHKTDNRRNVTQWVVVTHIVNPSHFYIRYVAEKRDSEILSMKINRLCSSSNYNFTSSDTVETGSVIFVKQKEGLWCRANVVEVEQSGCAGTVKACSVSQLASIRVFFIDSGQTANITIQREDHSSELSVRAVNNHLRKVSESVNEILGQFSPQAIRCSLKDLVPYDLPKGWTENAKVEFRSVVGSAAVEMRPLGQDQDSLLVDLRKAPMDQSSDVPISIREYLVFIEVARFYCPMSLGREPLSYYPPVYPKINKEVNAVVSHINSPSDFYVQLVDSMEYLLLSAKLQECYNATTVTEKEDLKVYCPVIEQAYVARYEDKLWYRAKVIGHPGGRKVEVRYVDFGSKKILPVSDLRKIKDEFFALPSMAINCCLSDVNPVDGEDWSEACSDRFISLVDQKLVTIVATGPTLKTMPLPVKLFESSLNGPLASIAELLVKEGLACFKKEVKSKTARLANPDPAVWDPPLDVSSAECADSPDQNQQSEETLEFQPQLKLPAQLKNLEVRVSHINSPSSFYIQLKSYDSHLKRMCELVKRECDPQVPDEDMVWKADMYCAAQINGIWERGQICSDVMSNDIAEVRRCDHGNKVKIHVSNLRKLPPSLFGSFTLECTLTDIRPAGGRSTWTATACDLISYYLTGALAVMTIKKLTDERPQPVTLLCLDKTGKLISIADFLTSEGLALRERKPRDEGDQKPKDDPTQSQVTETKTSGLGEDDKQGPSNSSPCPPLSAPVYPPTPPTPAPRTIMSAEKVKTELYQPPELPGVGHIQITVSAIGEDGIIYVRTQNAEHQLKLLKERIEQSIKTLPRQKPYTWRSVQGCAVIGSDMLWHRGQLLEVLGGDVKVKYVDYGLVENIPVVHVYPILLCDDVPQLCVPCQLHNTNPVGGRWQLDAVALLKELFLQNRCVDMQVMELPSDQRGPLAVEIFLDGMSLSRIMCYHEHASMERQVSSPKEHCMINPPFPDKWDIDTEGLLGPEEPMLGAFILPNLPEEGKHFKVRVKHIWTPNELFLWPLEGTDDVKVDGETLDEALTRINEDISSLPQLSNFPHGGPCLAEYSDGQYYRAKLIKIASVEPVMILVQHVDFGSDDTLPPSKLRQIPADLLGFPSQALKVKVDGFKPPSVKTQEGMLPYSPGWSVKATMAMIDLLHSNITASVVAREPELTVLLFDEDEELVHLSLVTRGLAELKNS